MIVVDNNDNGGYECLNNNDVDNDNDCDDNGGYECLNNNDVDNNDRCDCDDNGGNNHYHTTPHN